MATECGASVQICGMRFTLLDSTGDVSDAEDNSYVSAKVIDVGFAPDIAQGNQFNQECGCDGIQNTFKGRDKLLRFGFQLNRAAVEPALMSMLLNVVAIEEGDDVLGVAWGDDLGCDRQEIKAAFEFWTKHWVGDEQDADWPWWHNVYPTTIWQVGDSNYSGTAFAPEVLNGFTRTNTRWGQGPYGDGPGYDIRRGARFLTDEDPPVGECSFQHVEPGS